MQARIQDFELEPVESVAFRLWAAVATLRTREEVLEKMALVLERHRNAVRLDERRRVAASLRNRAGELVGAGSSAETMAQVTQLLAAAQVLDDYDG